MILLAFLVPLAIYSLLLARLNRNAHPVMVPGPWDCAGVLLAASGVLLLGGPEVLIWLHDRWRLAALLGRTHVFQHWGESWYFWESVWIAYFIVLAAGSAFALWCQRRKTSIYNINPATFAEVFPQVVDQLEMESLRSGRHLLLIFRRAEDKGVRPVSMTAEYAGTYVREGRRPLPPEVCETERVHQDWVALELDAFPALNHVTLRWEGRHPSIRREVETKLAEALAKIWTHDNPASGWFMSIALCLFSVTFLTLMGMVTLRILALWR